MAFFGFGKKKTNDCCSSCATQHEEVTSRVKVLGSGCAKCNQLEQATKEALAKLGVDTTVEHVTDFSKIANYGVMTTPALVVDDKVLSSGKVLKTSEVYELLKDINL